jgi:hypothetical protein
MVRRRIGTVLRFARTATEPVCPTPAAPAIVALRRSRSHAPWVPSFGLPTILGMAVAAHVAFFLVFQPVVQPRMLDASADVETMAAGTVLADARLFYGHFARMLVERGAYETADGPITSHMPGTSILLAASSRLTGNLGLYAIVQAAALFVAVAVYCRRACRAHRQSRVRLAALLFLLHPVTLLTSWSVTSEAFFTAALLLFFAALAGNEPPGTAAIVAAAVCLGIAAYFREVALVLAAGAAVALAVRWEARIRASVLFLLVFLLVLSPWMIRNARVTGMPSPGTSKAAVFFLYSSFGLTLAELNPFDPDERGAVRYDRVSRRVRELKERIGWGSGPLTQRVCLVEGLKNYLARPGRQAVSVALKAVNLVRPPVARRHLVRALPADLVTPAYAMLFVAHAGLIWGGLALVFRRRTPLTGLLRPMLVFNAVPCLLLWSEPRYIYPFYLPLILLAVNALARERPSPASP